MFNDVTDTRYGKMIYNLNDYGIGRSLSLYGEWVQSEVDFLLQFVKNSKLVIDVGANVGYHTLAFSKNINGHVLSFEPQKHVYAALVGNLALNSITNVDFFNLAVGETNAMINLPYYSPDQSFNFGDLSLKDTKTSSYIRSQMITLDSLGLPVCDFIKIDVEGYEREVLTGASETVKKYLPSVYLENNRQGQFADNINYFKKLGYKIWSHRPPTYSSNNFKNNSNNVFGNYLEPSLIAVHESKLSLLQDTKWIDQEIV